MPVLWAVGEDDKKSDEVNKFAISGCAGFSKNGGPSFSIRNG
jgi:hypothetical protein